MKVKEMIKALEEQPQDAEVYYLTDDSEFNEIADAKRAIPGNDETKEIVGDVFVFLK